MNIKLLTQWFTLFLGQLYELVPERAVAEAAAKQREEEIRKKKEEEARFREEMLAKRKETREKVISEIIQTETDYINSLQLCIYTVLGPQAEKVNDNTISDLYINENKNLFIE